MPGPNQMTGAGFANTCPDAADLSDIADWSPGYNLSGSNLIPGCQPNSDFSAWQDFFTVPTFYLGAVPHTVVSEDPYLQPEDN